MVKRILISLCLIFSAMVCRGEGIAQPDSSVLNALSSKLSEYFEAMKYEPVEVQKGECDFLIGSSSDSSIKSHIARTIYDYYIDNPVMGSEAVALHVFDKWFLPGHVKMNSDVEFMAAKIYAEFNRQSQVGCPAPEFAMEASDGSYVELFGASDKRDCFRVLYFYDTDCSNCRIQSILLSNVFASEPFPVEFYAIYTGDNRDEWQKYISERFDLPQSSAKFIHLWDPELDSDFQRKYGVLQTPRMFLISPDGEIKGRGLDALALSQMLHQIFDPVELQYGSKESADLFDGIFAGSIPSVADVKNVADQIASSTLPKGDTVMFRQMAGDYLYYLSTRSGEGIKEGLNYLVDTYILSGNKAWASADDSLKVVGFAQIMDDLLQKAAPGSRIADIKVPGLKLDRKGEKSYAKSLRKLKGDKNIIIFYTEGCNICDAEKQAAHNLVAEQVSEKIRVLMVNVDEIMRSNPALASRLFDSFDLSSLPYIVETDRKGLINRRYISLQ